MGFQIGGSETDVIFLVMNERGADRLLSSQFTLGGEGDVAAGPVGRSATAQTDANFHSGDSVLVASTRRFCGYLSAGSHAPTGSGRKQGFVWEEA